MGDVNGYMEDGTQLGGALRASIDLAAASELNMVEASDLASIALSTFGGELETEEERARFVNDAMNNFVKAADASVAEVSDLSAALKNVGPVAAGFGFSLQDTNNALAVLSTRGIRGAEAGTALRSMMTNLMRQTPKVTEALEAQGIALYDEQGNMMELVDIIGQFQVATESMTEAQRNQFVQTVAGTYGMKSLNTLMDEGIEGWYEMANATENATGIASQAEARAGTLAGQMEALEGNIETLKIRAGDELLPALKNLATTGNTLTTLFGSKLIGPVDSFGEALEKVTGFVSNFFLLIEEGEDPVTSIKASLMKVLPRDMWSDAIGAVDDFIDKIDNVRESVGKARTAIAPIVTKIKEFTANVKELIQPITTWFQENVKLKDILIVIGAFLAGPIIGAILSIVTTVGQAIIVFGSLVAAVTFLRNAWENNFGNIKAVILTVWEVIKSTFQAIKDTLGPQFNETLAFLKAVISEFGITWEGTWNVIKTIFQGVAVVIGALLMALIATITSLISAVADTVRFVAERLMVFRIIWKTALEGIQNFIKGAMTIIKGIFTADMNLIKEGFAIAWEGIKGIFKSMLQGIWASIKTYFGLVLNFIGKFIESVIKFFKNLKDKLVGNSIIPDMLDDILNVFKKVLNRVLEIVKSILDEILSVFKKVFDKILEVTKNLKNKFVSAMQSIADKVTPVKNAINKLKSAAESLWNWLSGKVFSFKVNLPSLPDWAIPGSPLPLHTAWKDFANEMNRMVIEPRVVIPNEVQALPVMAGSAGSVINNNRTTQVEVNASYANQQSPASVRYDVSAALAAANT
jgi:TP901 family phage tail tape measure protein